MSTFRGLGEVIAENGLFCSLYADRASHYWHTPEAGGGVDKDNPTPVGRALAQLGIELIAAYSPQARGRSERMFGTLQKRLPQELRLAGIATATTTSRRRSGCTNIPTATWPSSTDPGVWRATAPTAKPSTTTTGSRPRDPLRRDRARACG